MPLQKAIVNFSSVFRDLADKACTTHTLLIALVAAGCELRLSCCVDYLKNGTAAPAALKSFIALYLNIITQTDLVAYYPINAS